MTDTYTIAAAGLVDGQKRLETISRNAASATIPGFRRQVPGTSFPEKLATSGMVPNEVKSLPAAQRVDLRPGSVSMTGRPLDVAIEGPDGFFAVSDGAAIWLTRSGSFSLDAQGYLVGERGLRVQGTSGDIRLNTSNVEILPGGQLLSDGAVVAQLALFRPGDGAPVRADSGTLLSSTDSFVPVTDGSVHLRSGALENSNASATTEMVDLLTLNRQFESLVRVTQGYDELLGKTIQKLGEL